jgi:THO complex subunit 2
MDSQMRTNTSVLKAFEQTKGSWFSNVSTDIEGSEAYIESFFQFCVLPRCMSSDPDALFCAKFVELIHNLSTPHFSTILFFRYVNFIRIFLVF